MVLISGEVGAGKTFVSNMIASRLGASAQCVVLDHPPQSPKQMLMLLAGGLGMKISPRNDMSLLVEEIRQYLIRMQYRGKLISLIIDEAQDLNQRLLEEIRLIWNFQNNGQRLIQILLTGQPELRERLMQPHWESLRQRIVLSFHLGCLSMKETFGYITHRLNIVAKGEQKNIFTISAIKEIFHYTNGIPRLINVLCDNALLIGYVNSVNEIDEKIVAQVVRDMTCWGLQVKPETPKLDQDDNRTIQYQGV